MASLRDQKRKTAADQEVTARVPGDLAFDFDESDMEMIADERRGARHVVSLNPKLGRVVLYRAIYKEMEKAYGGPFDHVQLFLVSKYPQHFWVRPCKEDTKGGKKLHRTGETRMISAKMLLNRIGKDKGTHSIRYPARWDGQHAGLVVDTSTPA